MIGSGPPGARQDQEIDLFRKGLDGREILVRDVGLLTGPLVADCAAECFDALCDGLADVSEPDNARLFAADAEAGRQGKVTLRPVLVADKSEIIKEVRIRMLGRAPS
jgi:hypothetical protein